MVGNKYIEMPNIKMKENEKDGDGDDDHDEIIFANPIFLAFTLCFDSYFSFTFSDGVKFRCFV